MKKELSKPLNKINGTRVVSITARIVTIFALFILASNIVTNYINLVMNRSELVKLMRQLLVKDLKEVYNFCNNQFELYNYSKDLPASVREMSERPRKDFKNKHSSAFGLKEDGTILFFSKVNMPSNFTAPRLEPSLLAEVVSNREQGYNEGSVLFKVDGRRHIGIYKYNPKWQSYLFRAEEETEFYADSQRIFWNITIIIAVITLICAVAGIIVLRYITRFIRTITDSIMRMTHTQQLELIDLGKAENDNITFLGVAFNSLSSTINNLLSIFRKFVNKDIVVKAYREREIRLEGTQKELTILFSDIKSFTFITETLGSDIIKLLNLHYNRSIREIFNYDGLIGSIIGDALLAVYGALADCENSCMNKSLQAVMSGYRIQDVAESLRRGMKERREAIIKERGELNELEEKVYKAVLLEVGVGIDGGTVFYGNIGSNERMTNTVIGDNVNSASRLEGLTRIYHVPVICSEYVKNDIEQNERSHGLRFYEIDTVQVKGKTIGKKIYWPIPGELLTPELDKKLQIFEAALILYYDGKWSKALPLFQEADLPLCGEFIRRVSSAKVPADWSGIWTMMTK